MKTRFFNTFSAFVALAAILASCGPKEEPLVEVTSVSLSQTTLSIAKGGTTSLTANISPSNATNKTVTWSSSNPSVATVNAGTVNAIAVGSATITASASGKTASCEVTVTPKGVTSIRLDKGAASLNIKDVLTLVATVEPADADDKTLTWTSSDESVATVDNGKITAVG
ncbi:MAG: Ig domain-containing protein, partial [Bacteroidales bacterium]|nr:Ig domain-containing protein [Bacteroidales bacterium]